MDLDKLGTTLAVRVTTSVSQASVKANRQPSLRRRATRDVQRQAIRHAVQMTLSTNAVMVTHSSFGSVCDCPSQHGNKESRMHNHTM